MEPGVVYPPSPKGMVWPKEWGNTGHCGEGRAGAGQMEGPSSHQQLEFWSGDGPLKALPGE